jgi:hypothetical protein
MKDGEFIDQLSDHSLPNKVSAPWSSSMISELVCRQCLILKVISYTASKNKTLLK